MFDKTARNWEQNPTKQPAVISDDTELLMFPRKHSMEAVICVNKHLRTAGLQKYAV